MKITRVLMTVAFAAAVSMAFVVAPEKTWAADGVGNGLKVRLEVGGGVQAGDPEIEFGGVSGDLDTGTGYVAGAAVWVDGLGLEFLSLGVQYLRLAGNDFSETGSGTFLGVTVAGTLDIEPTIDAVMFNAALRKNDGTFHPYVGGGVGVAFSSADISASAVVVVGGSTFVVAGSADDNDTGIAGQVFGGVDVDVTDNIYLGVNGRYLVTSANLFGADVNFGNFAGMGVVGVRF